jgi:thymidylate synthase ThyX
MYEASILKHSVSEAGVELVTFEVNYPHAVHKDVMTHRWARNFQSFRAVPPEKLIAQFELGRYFTPEVFGSRVKGMGQGQEAIDQAVARDIWHQHVDDTLEKTKKFLALGIAKQQVNFLLQDLCFIRGIITTTLPQLHNFFGLRLDKNEDGDPVARPEVFKIAALMQEAYLTSTPRVIKSDTLHLPLVKGEEILQHLDWNFWKKVSVGRCARVSYLTHDGKRDPDKDVALHDSLQENGHMSPFEHQGQPLPDNKSSSICGSFGFGWAQYRKFIPGEAIYKGSHA